MNKEKIIRHFVNKDHYPTYVKICESHGVTPEAVDVIYDIVLEGLNNLQLMSSEHGNNKRPYIVYEIGNQISCSMQIDPDIKSVRIGFAKTETIKTILQTSGLPGGSNVN